MGTAGVKQGGGRYIAGDPLRGIACIVVLFWHTAVNAAGILPPPGVTAYYRHELGFLGRPIFTLSISVWLFFALSGYLIAGPFVRAVVRGDGRRPRALAFARNRVLRVVPGFWVLLTLTLLVVGTEGDSLKHIAAFYGFGHVYAQGPFTPRMVQAWTLDVEAVFYVLVPLLLLPLAVLLRGRGTPWFRAGVILAGLFVGGAASLKMGERWPTSGRIVAGSMWAFAPGVALATVEPLLRPRFEGRGFGRKVAWALLAMAAFVYVMQSYVLDFLSNRQQNLAAAFVCLGVLAGPLVLQWTTGSTWRLLDNRFLHWVGVRAYGVYLVHVLVLHELHDFTASLSSVRMALVTTFPMVLGISLVAGALSYRFVEKPFLDRRAPWRSPDPPPSSPDRTAVITPEPAPALAQP